MNDYMFHRFMSKVWQESDNEERKTLQEIIEKTMNWQTANLLISRLQESLK